MHVQYGAKALPVIRVCDVVVQDGSFAGVSAALASAQQGKRVVLVEPRIYLGREMTACLRPWIKLQELECHVNLPQVIQAILTSKCCKAIGDEVIFNMDQVKIALEDCLLSEGVQILYASRVIDVLGRQGELRGVVIGNKSCRQVIRCHSFQDFSNSGLGDPLTDTGDGKVIWGTLEFSDVDLSGAQGLAAPEFLGVANGIFCLHHGFAGENHWFVEFPIAPSIIQCCKYTQCREIERQRLMAQTAHYLLQHVDIFAGAYWVGASYEHCFGSQSLLERIAGASPSSGCFLPSDISRVEGGGAYGVSELDVFTNSGYDRFTVPSRDVPIADQVDVLVVGGGTSGVSAAITAAENGMSTMLVEMNPRLGGTGTIGGVHSYWYGRQVGFNVKLCTEVDETHLDLRQPIPMGSIPKWNIEVKAWTLQKMAQQRGVKVLLNCRAIGTVMDGQLVRGVVFSTPDGLMAVEARIVVDATGDGDLAAYSGARFTYGSERTGATMWYSLAQFSTPGRTKNNFTSMVDTGNIEDYTRAILSGRRRGEGCVEHGAYLATRESRQVLGDALITLTDQLRQRRYEDVIHIAFSNHDVKGHTDSDWLRVGLIPPNLEIEIPLGALIPKDLDHLLVVGKAISATHEALPAIRMQRDLENLGSVAGIVAAVAVERNCGLREIPVVEIQKRLVRDGSLPAEVLTRSHTPVVCDVEAQLKRLSSASPLYAYSDMDFHEIYRDTIPFVELCCAGEDAIPQIRQALQQADRERGILLAQVLAMMGDAGGIEELLDAIQENLEAGILPPRNASIRNSQLPPDQGAMPDVVYWLYSLGMLRDERAIEVWERLALLLQQTTAEDFYSQTKGTFYYLDAICYGVERLGSARCKGVLQKLRQIPYLQNQVCRELIQVDFVLERMAFIELAIARAMLCCGMQDGLLVLIDYLEDTRASLRQQAYALLVKFTGLDYKVGAMAWRHWYASAECNLTSMPDTTLTDAQKAW